MITWRTVTVALLLVVFVITPATLALDVGVFKGRYVLFPVLDMLYGD